MLFNCWVFYASINYKSYDDNSTFLNSEFIFEIIRRPLPKHIGSIYSSPEKDHCEPPALPHRHATSASLQQAFYHDLDVLAGTLCVHVQFLHPVHPRLIVRLVIVLVVLPSAPAPGVFLEGEKGPSKIPGATLSYIGVRCIIDIGEL